MHWLHSQISMMDFDMVKKQLGVKSSAILSVAESIIKLAEVLNKHTRD